MVTFALAAGLLGVGLIVTFGALDGQLYDLVNSAVDALSTF